MKWCSALRAALRLIKRVNVYCGPLRCVFALTPDSKSSVCLSALALNPAIQFLLCHRHIAVLGMVQDSLLYYPVFRLAWLCLLFGASVSGLHGVLQRLQE